MDNTPTSLTVKNTLFQLQAIAIRGRRLGPRYRHVQWEAEMEAARTLYKEAIAADKAAREKADRILAERKAAQERVAQERAAEERAARILAERKAAQKEAARKQAANILICKENLRRTLAERKALEENTRKLADIEWMKQLTERRCW